MTKTQTRPHQVADSILEMVEQLTPKQTQLLDEQIKLAQSANRIPSIKLDWSNLHQHYFEKLNALPNKPAHKAAWYALLPFLQTGITDREAELLQQPWRKIIEGPTGNPA